MFRKVTFSPCTARFSTGAAIETREAAALDEYELLLAGVVLHHALSGTDFLSICAHEVQVPRALTLSIRVAASNGDGAVVEPVAVPGAGVALGEADGVAGEKAVELETVGVAEAGSDVCATTGASMAAARPRVGFVIVVAFINVQAGSMSGRNSVRTAALKVLLCNKGGGAQS
jgi:hypothetical protein